MDGGLRCQRVPIDRAQTAPVASSRSPKANNVIVLQENLFNSSPHRQPFRVSSRPHLGRGREREVGAL